MTAQRAPLDGEHFDVLVIGGGINGVAIARECARAARRVLLLEQHDFASGTTCRSTRIIHGGLRYLEHGEIALVRESLRGRERLRRERPHLIRPLRFLLALPPEGRHSALAVRAGLWLYATLGGGRRSPAEGELKRLERLLDAGQHWSIFHYDDAQCEFPERLVAEWLAEALAAGAAARNYTRVLQVETREGRARSVLLCDLLNSHETRVSAQWVINASGPWADRLCAASSIRTPTPLLGGLRGSHLLLPQFPGAPESAVYTEAMDGRPIFLIPWNGRLLVGTTEVPDSGDPAAAQPDSTEIEYLFHSVARLFPGTRLLWNDVQASFAGVRPLPYSPDTQPAAVTRRHRLHDHAQDGAAGMLSIIGGKLTTAASLGRECARRLGIAVEEPEVVQGPAAAEMEAALQQWHSHLTQLGHLEEPTAHAIADWYGPRAPEIAQLAAADDSLRAPLCPHSEHILAEALFAARQECAATLGDILLRRVPVALGACWSEECSRWAARHLAAVLGWDERRTGAELENFEAERDAFLRRSVAVPA